MKDVRRANARIQSRSSDDIMHKTCYRRELVQTKHRRCTEMGLGQAFEQGHLSGIHSAACQAVPPDLAKEERAAASSVSYGAHISVRFHTGVFTRSLPANGIAAGNVFYGLVHSAQHSHGPSLSSAAPVGLERRTVTPDSAFSTKRSLRAMGPLCQGDVTRRGVVV